MVRKGVSYEEKRTRMMDYFYEHVFSLKELEKHLPKVKGIVMQSVKEVLQSLVDDNMVDFDKIGSGNFYWALPSKASLKRKTMEDGLMASIQQEQENKSTLEKELKEAMVGRSDTEKRREALKSLSALQARVAELDAEIEHYQSHGAHKLESLTKKSEICREACTRWTDNVFNMIAFFKKQRPEMKESDLLEYFGLAKEFDYIE